MVLVWDEVFLVVYGWGFFSERRLIMNSFHSRHGRKAVGWLQDTWEAAQWCERHRGAKPKLLLHLFGKPTFQASIPSQYSFLFLSSSTYLQTAWAIICNNQSRDLVSQHRARWCTRTKTPTQKKHSEVAAKCSGRLLHKLAGIKTLYWASNRTWIMSKFTPLTQEKEIKISDKWEAISLKEKKSNIYIPFLALSSDFLQLLPYNIKFYIGLLYC